jgi:cellulose synthase operon protein YhjU
MSFWHLLFLSKVGLHFGGYIGLDWRLNLLLWLCMVPPIAHNGWRLARTAVALPAAGALLYADSYLPSITRVLSQLKALSGFSADYWLELAQRIFHPGALLAGLVGIVLYTALARRVRVGTFALLALLSVPVVTALQEHAATPQATANTAGSQTQGTAPHDSQDVSPDALLEQFYANESQKRIQFTAPGAPPAFDIIVLHVCSLSWDDMEFVGQRDHPFLKRFDVLFTNFNSAASYSGPASLRVLHGTCGQTPHDKLYEGIDPQCYVFPNLEKAGYQTAALLNHDGVYEEFAHALEQRGGLAGKLQPNRGAPVHMQNFDGSPIYNDHALLSQWWQRRSNDRSEGPVALYYNTISLHDGNRVPGMASRNSLETFKPRLLQLLADFDKFISELESAGRPVVVMLIPEHGASLRGDKIQMSGMREIPGPRITLVPAAVKLVGMKQPDAPAGNAPVVVNQPTSYLGLYTLLGDLIRDNPYVGSSRPLAERLAAPATTPFVSENADVIVMRNLDGRYLMRSGKGEWIHYTY